jgi:serine/threonine protein kinase
LTTSKLSVFESLKIIKQLLETLVKAHAIGITFGDLYSENILYSENDQTTTIIDIDFESEFTLNYIQENIVETGI